jgi:hypothetical protein
MKRHGWVFGFTIIRISSGGSDDTVLTNDVHSQMLNPKLTRALCLTWKLPQDSSPHVAYNVDNAKCGGMLRFILSIIEMSANHIYHSDCGLVMYDVSFNFQ